MEKVPPKPKKSSKYIEMNYTNIILIGAVILFLASIVLWGASIKKYKEVEDYVRTLGIKNIPASNVIIDSPAGDIDLQEIMNNTFK